MLDGSLTSALKGAGAVSTRTTEMPPGTAIPLLVPIQALKFRFLSRIDLELLVEVLGLRI